MFINIFKVVRVAQSLIVCVFVAHYCLSFFELRLLITPLVSLKPFCTIAIITWLAIREYLCHKWPRMCSTCRYITSFVTRAPRRVPLMEHVSSSPVFSGVCTRVVRCLVFFVVFCRSLFVLLSFFFDHCVVCPSIYGFW